MLIADCKGCKHCQWMVGIGLGVRCSHGFNQQFKDGDYEGLVIISSVPKCEMFNPPNEPESSDEKKPLD